MSKSLYILDTTMEVPMWCLRGVYVEWTEVVQGKHSSTSSERLSRHVSCLKLMCNRRVQREHTLPLDVNRRDTQSAPYHHLVPLSLWSQHGAQLEA